MNHNTVTTTDSKYVVHMYLASGSAPELREELQLDLVSYLVLEVFILKRREKIKDSSFQVGTVFILIAQKYINSLFEIKQKINKF